MSAAPKISDELAASVRAKRTARPWFDAAPAPTEAASPAAILMAYKIGGAVKGSDLDRFGREVYAAHCGGELSDVEVRHLDALRVERRAEQQRRWRWWEHVYGPRVTAPRDRAAAKMRRRGLVRLGLMPPNVANLLTPGEEAVAAIYAEDFRRKGYCDDSKAQLAVRAGVCERVVQRAQKALHKEGKITVEERKRPGQRHATTIVVIRDGAWRLWLRNRRVPERRSATGVGDWRRRRQGQSPPTHTDKREASPKGAAAKGDVRGEHEARSGPTEQQHVA
jgi:hypothetical protein